MEALDDGKAVEIILKALEFRTTVLTLVLGATAFAAGRMWPENRPLPDRRVLLRLVPALLFSVVAFWLLRNDFSSLAAASYHGMTAFTTQWINDSFWTDLCIGGAFLWLCFGVGFRT
jgi:hypothetical protein